MPDDLGEAYKRFFSGTPINTEEEAKLLTQAIEQLTGATKRRIIREIHKNLIEKAKQ